MKREAALSLSIAFASIALLSSAVVQARTADPMNATKSAASISAAEREAMQMAPAQAALDQGLDARKIKPGAVFRATLTDTVLLKNGPELPRGTVLTGKVVTDQMQPGNSRLALRFNQAELKSGEVVPIKATIMEVASPQDDYIDDNDNRSLDSWNGKTVQVDQINALAGADLHSRIASNDSGVFVSEKKDNLRLPAGSRIALVIAVQHRNQRTSNAMTGGA